MGSTIVGVKVSESEAKRLLAAVRRARAMIDRGQDVQREAVRAAVAAGVPRQRIADELGMHRNMVRRIAERD